ncbi:hypothetical protein OSTOST_22318, partial [Ostertagia ostertagi]
MSRLIWLAGLTATVWTYDFSDWLPPFNESSRIYELCTNEMDEVILIRPDLSRIFLHGKNSGLCYLGFRKICTKKGSRFGVDDAIVEICDKGRLVAKEEHFDLYLYSSLFKALYERDNMDRMQILSTSLRCLLRPLQSMLCAACFKTSA